MVEFLYTMLKMLGSVPSMEKESKTPVGPGQILNKMDYFLCVSLGV